MASQALSTRHWGLHSGAQEKGTLSFESSIFHLHDEKSEHEHGHTSTSEDDLMKFDSRKIIAPRHPRWANVVARITIDDETGHIMSLEYTKHMTEKDLHRNLPSVRDIRTVLLHFSLVTPNQQLKQSFQTFAALPVDETTQQTSQIQTTVQYELSVGSDHSGVIAKDLLKSLILASVSLDDAVVDPWMKATRYGRVDFAEVCCTSDSLLSGAVTSLGGRAVQYSHWNGFDLTTKAGTDKLKKRIFVMTPLCSTQRSQQSQSRSRFHRVQMNILVVFLWLVKQDWCEAILEQMWGSTSLCRGGVFFELIEQFHSGRTPGCQWSSLADGMLSSKSWFFICSHRRWSDLLCSRRCLLDHSHQTLEKETLRYTPQLVKTVAKEIMKEESSKQIRSQTCCSVTIDSKNHLVAPAVSTDDYPVIQEDAHRRLSEEELRASDLLTEEERETARTIVSRLHVELGHSDPRGMIGSLRRKHAHRHTIATARKFSCSACGESQRRRLRPVAARILHEPGTCLQVDQFEWKHPVLNLHELGTIMVDAGSRAASVTIHRVMDVEHGLGNVTGDIMLATLLNHWVKYYGKPDIVRTDPERAFRDQGFRRGLAAKSMRLDIDPGDASWKTGVLGKTLDTIKQSATRVARTTPDSVTIQEVVDECTTAHNDLHRNRGFSPWQLLLGKTPTDKSVCENPDLAQCSVEVVDEAAK